MLLLHVGVFGTACSNAVTVSIQGALTVFSLGRCEPVLLETVATLGV